VASAGLYASLHLTPDRQPCQHPITLFLTGRMHFLPPNQQRQSTVKFLADPCLNYRASPAQPVETLTRCLKKLLVSGPVTHIHSVYVYDLLCRLQSFRHGSRPSSLWHVYGYAIVIRHVGLPEIFFSASTNRRLVFFTDASISASSAKEETQYLLTFIVLTYIRTCPHLIGHLLLRSPRPLTSK